MTKPTDKIETPVVYHGHLSDYYEEYMRDSSKHNSKKWDDKEDLVLGEMKEHIKRFYYIAQNHSCVYCKQEIAVKHLAIWDAEHILPKDKYPQFLLEPKNLCLSCKDCNRAKWDEDILMKGSAREYPKNGDSIRIIHPHFDSYEKHIEVLKLGCIYQAKTRKGAETISVCGLFRFIKDTTYSDVPSKILNEVVSITEKIHEPDNPGVQFALLEIMIKQIEEAKKRITENIISSNPGLLKNLSSKKVPLKNLPQPK